MNSFQNPKQKRGGSFPLEASLTEIYSWLLVMTFLLFLQHIRCWASLFIFPLSYLLGPIPSHCTWQTHYMSENWKIEPYILHLWFEVISSHELTRTPTPNKQTKKPQWPPPLTTNNRIIIEIWSCPKSEHRMKEIGPKKRKTRWFISHTAYLHFYIFVPCK